MKQIKTSQSARPLGLGLLAACFYVIVIGCQNKSETIDNNPLLCPNNGCPGVTVSNNASILISAVGVSYYTSSKLTLSVDLYADASQYNSNDPLAYQNFSGNIAYSGTLQIDPNLNGTGTAFGIPIVTGVPGATNPNYTSGLCGAPPGRYALQAYTQGYIQGQVGSATLSGGEVLGTGPNNITIRMQMAVPGSGYTTVLTSSDSSTPLSRGGSMNRIVGSFVLSQVNGQSCNSMLIFQ